MKVLGIVVEYNPFHNGHIYHIQKAKQIVKPDYTIAVMSSHLFKEVNQQLLINGHVVI